MTSDVLLYTRLEDETLLFVPAGTAAEIREIHRRLPSCRTYGAARRWMSAHWFAEFVDDFVAPVKQPPDDEDPIDTDGQAWPRLPESVTLASLPDEIVARFARELNGAFGSWRVLPEECEDDIVIALGQLGINCEYDSDLDELVEISD